MITYSCDDAGCYATLGDHARRRPQAGRDDRDRPARPARQERPPARFPKSPIPTRCLRPDERAPTCHVARPPSAAGRNWTIRRGCSMLRLMMSLALQRARTAREAIQVMTNLVERVRLRRRGRVDLHRRHARGVDPGDRRHRPRRQGRGLGRRCACPTARSPATANQSRIGEFPRNDPANCLFSENVESFAASKGWYDPKSGQPFRFLRGLLPADALVAADLRHAGVEHSAAGGAVAAFLARLPPLQARLAALSALAAAGRQALGGRRLRPDARPLRGDRVRHDARRRRRALTAAAALAAVGLEGRRRRVRLGAAHLHAADRASPSCRNRGPGCPTRSAGCSGTASTTPTRPATCRFTAASTPCRRASRAARTASSPGTRPGGSSTSRRTTPI